MGALEKELIAAIGYDPKTGDFWWIDPPASGKVRAGDRAGFFNSLGYRVIKYKQKPYGAFAREV